MTPATATVFTGISGNQNRGTFGQILGEMSSLIKSASPIEQEAFNRDLHNIQTGLTHNEGDSPQTQREKTLFFVREIKNLKSKISKALEGKGVDTSPMSAVDSQLEEVSKEIENAEKSNASSDSAPKSTESTESNQKKKNLLLLLLKKQKFLLLHNSRAIQKAAY
jgi:hypothetical protein